MYLPGLIPLHNRITVGGYEDCVRTLSARISSRELLSSLLQTTFPSFQLPWAPTSLIDFLTNFFSLQLLWFIPHFREQKSRTFRPVSGPFYLHLCVNAYLLLLLLPCTDGWSVVIGSIAQIVVRLLWRNPCILILLYPYTRSVSHPTLQSSYEVCCLRLNAFVLDTSVSMSRMLELEAWTRYLRSIDLF